MKKNRNTFYFFILVLSMTGCSSSDDNPADIDISCTPSEINVDYTETITTINVTVSKEWSVYSNESWITCSPKNSIDSNGTVTVTIAVNPKVEERNGTVVFKSGISRAVVSIKQSAKPEEPIDPSIKVPEGYKLVWHDEFNEGKEPSSDWYYETGSDGWGNNELQTYVAGYEGSNQLAVIKDGTLSIIAKKIDNKIYSIRMNTNESWKYGYFEARLQLPVGKGTWPAFWMMPKNSTSWPGDGEIDIMEEVGYRPNYVSSAIHCNSYNHTINTEKTQETLIPTAQAELHTYALEWTEDYIRTYVDGKELFYFANDQKGNKDTWPFNSAFYIKLNLAWGGNWGGSQGVDDSVLPATYKVDYVRVFQKK